MSLEAKVNEQIKVAMKAKNDAELRTLRAIKAALLLEKTSEGFSGEITEAQEMKILQKMAKQRKDSLSIFEQQNRTDLAKTEQEELSIIEQFLPAALSADELKVELQKIIEQVGAKSAADMGKVMGLASKSLAGKADGKAISDMVKQLLS